MVNDIPSEEVEPQTHQHSSRSSTLASKWLGFVSALWVQAISGNNYTFANYSVELKAILGINQVRLNGLSSAKDVGKAFGVVAGFLCDYLPPWSILLIGSLEGMLGYGAQWLVISRKIKPLPYWMMCIVLCMGGNSTVWMNTAVLVTCLRNFRWNRGPVSGILKAYVGLSTAIFTDLCTALFGGDASAFVLMLALIPLGVCAVAMFLLKPVECDHNVDGEHQESQCFSVLNSVAIVLAFYLLAYDLSGIKNAFLSKLIAGGLCIILVAPVALPIYLHCRVGRCKQQTSFREPTLKQNGKEQGATIAMVPRGAERLSLVVEDAEVNTDVESSKGLGEVMGHREASTVDSEAMGHTGAERMSTIAGEAAVHRDVEVSKTQEELVVPGNVVEVSATESVAMGPRGTKEVFTSKRGVRVYIDGAEVSTREGEAMVHRETEVSSSEGEVIIHRDAEDRAPGGEVMLHRDTEMVLKTSRGRHAKMSLTEREAIAHGDVEKLSATEECQGGIDAHITRKRIGDEFTVQESIKTVDFWVLFFCFLCGVGPGMAVINNMGQIGQSMGYSRVSIFVSLISIWGFFGRLVSGVLSEYLIRWKAVPRPVLLAASQLVMVLGYLLLATGAVGSLHIGSIVVGVCYGVRLSVSVPVASEMFGLKALGLTYNLLILNLPLGSVLFSSVLAGFLYDHEAAKDGSSNRCLGAHCYRLVFLLMAAVSGMGFVLDCILTLRTRSLYQRICRTKHSKS
ncbi:hypothetical protein GOP47_0018052 [Adiantum capillus-veneris]|uniref:Nodulin-like domain-containing protein n=1 Tax=Adiantum capillus-veneris TaxID=13818 RepID=A0A9D4ZA99_ADICA|nr:hypothetical protein GOP47_0018052 [Adiantum capillus-veneris]